MRLYEVVWAGPEELADSEYHHHERVDAESAAEAVWAVLADGEDSGGWRAVVNPSRVVVLRVERVR